MYDIFVNYRHEDSHAAGRLNDRLREEFTPFIDEVMESGARIDREIEDALNEARVVIAIIGEKWVSRRNLRRLHQPNDWITRELTHALARSGVLLIPVIVDDIRMPAEDQVPQALHPFLLCKARYLHKDNWEEDVKDFIEWLRTQLPGKAARAQPQDLSGGLPHLCDRVQQEQDFEALAAQARTSKSLVCVLPGHKYEAHTGFVTRLRLRRKLEQLFNCPSSGVDIHPLLWNRGQAKQGRYEAMLYSAIKSGVLNNSAVDDEALGGHLRHLQRPAILMLQVTWADLKAHGADFPREIGTAWQRIIGQLAGPLAQPLLLWINLSYDEPHQQFVANGLPQLATLEPVLESDIQAWLALDEVQQCVAGHEMALLDIANDSRYCIAPGQMHMMRFVDAVRDTLNSRR